jgi:aryl-alcohol dehydrogenase
MGDATPQVLIPQLVELVKTGVLPLKRLTKHYRLEQLDQAAHDMHSGVTVKPVIVY